MLGASVGFSLMSTCVAGAHALDPQLHTLVSSLARASVNLLVLCALAHFRWRELFGDFRPALWSRGITGALSLLLYFGALAYTTAGEAAFLNNTSAFWVAALAPLALGEATSGRTWWAIVGSLVGTALLGWPRAEALAGDATGRLLGLGSGLFAALAYLSVRKASASNGPRVIVFYFTLLATMFCLMALPFVQATPPQGAITWLLLVAAGVFATGAQVLMTSAYAIGPAAPLAAVAAATPLFTTLLAISILGQVPDRWALLGMAVLTVAGIALPILHSRRQ